MKKIYLQIEYIKNKKIEGYILDLSRSGMGLAAAERLSKGLNIVIAPEIKLLPKLQAEIIYTSKLPRKRYPYRTGIKFINLNQKQKSCLNRFMNKLE